VRRCCEGSLKLDDHDHAEGWPSPVEGVRLEISPPRGPLYSVVVHRLNKSRQIPGSWQTLTSGDDDRIGPTATAYDSELARKLPGPGLRLFRWRSKSACAQRPTFRVTRATHGHSVRAGLWILLGAFTQPVPGHPIEPGRSPVPRPAHVLGPGGCAFSVGAQKAPARSARHEATARRKTRSLRGAPRCGFVWVHLRSRPAVPDRASSESRFLARAADRGGMRGHLDRTKKAVATSTYRLGFAGF